MMIFLLDDSEELSFLEYALTSTTLSGLINHLRDAQKVQLWDSKLKLEHGFCLKSSLPFLGVKTCSLVTALAYLESSRLGSQPSLT
ncbi:hypothetical protein HPB48_021746 [Haemaphysalis longicornis]|uniref:Uncharacterized protein n=1 Tax=Haemaphysalis longicornis TaxID=44386 RepID=A0A9J6GJ11_HAELO|nr:hypothetical protein HPB48_021746 [Haemaphysalis longicornis]